MATLNIGGQRITVGDAFLSMSPQEQQASVEEIAAQLQSQDPAQPQPTPWPSQTTQPQSSYAGVDLPIPGTGFNPEQSTPIGSALDPLMHGATFGFSDEIEGLKGGVGRFLQGGDFGAGYGEGQQEGRDRLAGYREENPWLSTGLEIAAAIPTSLVGGGAALAAKGATLGARAGMGALVGAGQGVIYGAGTSEGDLGDRALGGLTGGTFGAGFGAVAPFLGNWVAKFARRGAQGKILDQVARTAQSSGEIKTAASSVFESATGANAPMVLDDAYRNLANGFRAQATKMRLNEHLSAKGVGLMQMIDEMARDLGSGVVVDLGDLHILRQVAGEVAQSNEGASKAFASHVIRNLDDFIKQPNVYHGSDGKAGNALMSGISMWNRANKVSLVEEAIRRGQSAASGPEKGVRNALRSLVNKPSAWNRFNDAEQQAILDVVNGTPGSNLMKLIGTFGFGGNQATTGVGGAVGMGLGSMVGGPFGMVAAPIIGSIGKRASERTTNRLANRALGAVGAPKLNILSPVDQASVTAVESALRRLGTPLTGQAVGR